MVSGGFSRERDPARYRKRKPWPAVAIALLLGVAAVVVWVKVINKASDVNAAVACAPSSTQPVAAAGQPKPQPGNVLPYNALDQVPAAPPTEVKVQVYNASTQRGAATQASNQLTQAGFQVGNPANDPLYPKQDMNCRGQIRFGANGESAARTLSLLVPCTQLVKDGRQDTTVDLSIGTNFTAVNPNNQAKQLVQQLGTWASTHPAPQGGQQAQGQLPQLDQNLLSQAHSTQC